MPEDRVRQLVTEQTEGRWLGLLGEPRVKRIGAQSGAGSDGGTLAGWPQLGPRIPVADGRLARRC